MWFGREGLDCMAEMEQPMTIVVVVVVVGGWESW